MDGDIYLFRRADYVKPTWFCRIKTPGAKGYSTKSTKATKEHDAYAFAKAMYNQNLGLVATGRDMRSKYVKDVLSEYADAVRTSEPDGPTRKSKLSYLTRWGNFFGNTRIKELDKAKIVELTEWTSSMSAKGKVSDNTVNRFLKYLKQFLKWCEDRGHIDKVPTFPKTKSKSGRRTHFDADYRKLTRAMREFVGFWPLADL